MFNTKTGRHDTNNQRSRNGKGITRYTSKTVSLEILLKHVHRNMGDTGVGSMSVSVMTTTSPDDSVTTAMHGHNQTLHNTLWNELPLTLQQWRRKGPKGGGGGGGAHRYVIFGKEPI